LNDILTKLAPLLGSALLGPFGGIAASFIADKLGVPEKTVKAVSEALSNDKLTPDQVAQVKMAEIEFKKWMGDNEIKLEQISADDRKSAREMQTSVHSNIPGTLAIIIVSGFFAILICMMLGLLKVSDQQSLLILLGALSAGFGNVLSFYYGSNISSKAKDATIAKSLGK
jgi:ABC-type dipeptide/oligopeptide/nickel transport system permease component